MIAPFPLSVLFFYTLVIFFPPHGEISRAFRQNTHTNKIKVNQNLKKNLVILMQESKARPLSQAAQDVAQW